MANRWETVETVSDFIFGGLQNHCRWWLQPWNEKTLTPWKKSYDQTRQHIKKQRHYFANKGPPSQGYVFSSGHVWMWELDYKESWTPKNDAFELCCWRRLLRAPWTARRSSQSVIKEISPEYALEGLMLKLKLQSFGHLMWRTDSFEKTLMLGKIEGRRRRGNRRWDGRMALLTLWAWVWVNSGVGAGQGGLACCSPWGLRVGYDWTTELNWTDAAT